MCLSIPSKIISIDANNFATVETLGVRRGVSLDLISEKLNPGDFVLIHVGFAMQKIDTEYALESLKVYEEIAKNIEDDEVSKEDDLYLYSKHVLKASKNKK